MNEFAMPPRSVVMISPPVVEPVSLSTAKQHLRIAEDQTDDDTYILALLATGRRIIERRLGISLVATEYRATWSYAPGSILIPNPPLLTGGSYSFEITADGTVVDPETYTLDTDSRPANVVFDAIPGGVIAVTYWAGVAPGGIVAPQLKSALLLYVGHLFAHREAVSQDGASELPMAFEMLLASESVMGVW